MDVGRNRHWNIKVCTQDEPMVKIWNSCSCSLPTSILTKLLLTLYEGVYVNTMYVQVGIIKGKHDSNFKQCHVY